MAKRHKPSKARKAVEDLIEDVEEGGSFALALPSTTGMGLYLDEDNEGQQVILALVPPDLLRCQCEWPDHTTSTFGPKPIKRCEDDPTVIAFQRRQTGDHTPTGAMSLCDDHKVMIEHMHPGQCYFREITSNKKIGSLV